MKKTAPSKKPTPAAVRKARARARSAATPTPPLSTPAAPLFGAGSELLTLALLTLLPSHAADGVLRALLLRLVDLLVALTHGKHSADDWHARLAPFAAEARARLGASDAVDVPPAARTLLKIELDAAQVAMRTAERDAARDTLATVADRLGLVTWATNTPEGLRAIVEAAQDLRRGHDHAVQDLHRAERERDTTRAELDRLKAERATRDPTADARDLAATRAELQTMRQRLADLLAAVELPYLVTYADGMHDKILAAARQRCDDLRDANDARRAAEVERDEALAAKHTADELLTHATTENAELRRRLAELPSASREPAAEPS
jgi:hypothetical protein